MYVKYDIMDFQKIRFIFTLFYLITIGMLCRSSSLIIKTKYFIDKHKI